MSNVRHIEYEVFAETGLISICCSCFYLKDNEWYGSIQLLSYSVTVTQLQLLS